MSISRDNVQLAKKMFKKASVSALVNRKSSKREL